MIVPGFYYYLNLLSSLLGLIVLLSPAAIGYVIHRKLHLAAVRKEEIKRLLLLASEEAARAELEATSDYIYTNTVSISDFPAGQFQCAVCYCPTTTRCARCKSIHYCSGKCQVIHWRRGHKEECHLSNTTYQNINNISNPSSNYSNLDQTQEPQFTKPVKSTDEETANSNSSHSPNIFHEKDDALNQEFISDLKETNTPDEVPLNDTIVFDVDITSNTLKPHQPKPISAELNSSSDDLYSSTRSNQLKSSGNVGETQHASLGSSDLSSNESSCSISEPLTASNGFWDGVLDSNWSIKNDHIDQFHFNHKEEGATSLPDFGINSTKLDDPRTSDLGKNVANGDSLSRKIKIDGQEEKHLQLPKFFHDVTISNLDPRRSKKSSILSPSVVHLSSNIDRETTKTEVLKPISISSPIFKSSSHYLNDMGPSHYVRSKEYRTPLSRASNGHSPCNDVSYSVPNGKIGKIANTSSIANHDLKKSISKAVDQVSKLSELNSLEAGGEISRRYGSKGLFSYDLFIKLYAWNKVELVPCGLINCGNSCYANAVLQCLTFTQPLNAYFLQGLHSKACLNKEWCLTCEFERLILKAKEGNSPLSPSRILSHLQKNGSHLGNGREEDAHEFLRYIIDKMQYVCLKESNASGGSMIEETTLIGLTFGGYLRSKIKCMKCHGKSERHEKIMDLTVEIEGDIRTLEEALRKFTSTEILDGENKYHCSRCKSYEKAKKKLEISEAPNILTITLKRFQSGKFGKLNKPIEFPEILDMAKYISGTSDKSPIYKLYGVVVHLDIMNAAFSGHYVCYIKNNQNNWYKIDDSTVKLVELKRVKEKGAYMLFYSRWSPRAPRLLRNRDSNTKLAMAKSVFPWATPNNIQTHHNSSSSEFLYPPYPIRTNLETDSNSDTSSLFSSKSSEESSCSTESTRNSSSTADDLSDYIFGDVGPGFTNPWRNSSDSDTSSSSSSPLFGRNSPLADLDRYVCRAPEKSGSRRSNAPFLSSNLSKESKKLPSSSSYREAGLDKTGKNNIFENFKFGRRSSKERTS